MDESVPDSGLLEAVPLVFEIASRLEEAEAAYRSLVNLVGEFSNLTTDEIAARLNVSARHAELMTRRSPFSEFVALTYGVPNEGAAGA